MLGVPNVPNTEGLAASLNSLAIGAAMFDVVWAADVPNTKLFLGHAALVLVTEPVAVVEPAEPTADAGAVVVFKALDEPNTKLLEFDDD